MAKEIFQHSNKYVRTVKFQLILYGPITIHILIIPSSASTVFSERALYVHALQNIGYGSVLDSLLEMARKRTAIEDENANDLRVYIINGLNAYKKQAKVCEEIM